MGTKELLQICHGDPGQTRHFGRPKCADSHTYGGHNMSGMCSGLMKPDTHLGENARQIEVSDDQTTPFLFC